MDSPDSAIIGMLKKAASGVIAAWPCSRTPPDAPLVQEAAALPEERHVLACTGWAGGIANLFEHSSILVVVVDYLAMGLWVMTGAGCRCFTETSLQDGTDTHAHAGGQRFMVFL